MMIKQAAIDLIVALKGYTLPKQAEYAYNQLCKAISEQEEHCSWPNCLTESAQEILSHKTMNEMGEPTAFICQGNLYWSNDVDPYCAASHIPLYVSPPKQPWKGLTDEDKQIAFDDSQEGGGFWEFADAIEAILKRKNDGKDST